MMLNILSLDGTTPEDLLYNGTVEVPSWSFFKWKSKKMISKPKLALVIDDFDIFDPTYTKEEVESIIRKNFKKEDRRKEIENNELI